MADTKLDELTEQLAGVVDGQAAARDAIITGTAAGVVALWAGFGDWYSTRAIGELTSSSLKLMRAGKRGTANLTNAYLTRTIAATAGGRRRPPARLVDVDALRLDPFTGRPMVPAMLQHVAGRPADTYRYARATKANQLEARLARRALDEVAEQALEADRARYTVEALRETRSLEFDDTEFVELALTRAERITGDELLLAERHQGRKTMSDDNRVQGYRRIIHPELSEDTGVCGLCVAASDRRYYVAELLPLHDGCNCTVLPIVNGRDPGDNLNNIDLGNLYAIAGTTYAEGLVKTRFQVNTHGELGPVLAEQAKPIIDAEFAATRERARASLEREFGGRDAADVREDTSPRRRPRSGGGTADQEDDNP